MRKKILISLSLILAVLCFTGCMHVEEHITVEADGSGTAVSVVQFEKETVDQLAASMETTAEELLGDSNAEICIVDGVEYYKVSESITFDSYEALKKSLEAEEYTGRTLRQ